MSPLRRLVPALLTAMLLLPPAQAADMADGSAAIATEWDDTEVRLEADGTYQRRIHKRYRILNERGKKYYSEVEFGYRPDIETITIDRAETIEPDGARRPVQANAIADTSPYSDEPAYDRYRVKTFTLPATGPGAICDYQVTLRGRGKPGRFTDSRFLQGSEPADLIRYSLVAPASMALNARVVNARPDVRVSAKTVAEGAYLRRVWTATMPHPLVSERQMPRWRDLATRVAVTTTASWRNVAAEWRHLSQGKDHVSPQLEALVQRLTRAAATPAAKAAAIVNYVLQDIRYVAVDLTVAGLEPQSAHAVWQNRYGDCKDGSTLLKTMLSIAGIPANYVLVSTNERGRVDHGLPGINQFDHCIVAAELPNGRVYLDSVGKTTAFGDLPAMDQGAEGLLVGPDDATFVTLPRTRPKDNAVISEQKLVLLPNGSLQSEVREHFSGSLAANERQSYLGRTPKQIGEEFQRQAENLVAGGRLLRHAISPVEDLRRPFETAFAYAVDDFATVAGDLLIFKVPGSGFGLGLFSAPSREQPIAWWTTERYVDHAEIRLPAGYRPRFLPAPLVLDTPDVRFRAGYRYADGKLYYDSTTDYQSAFVPATAYAALRRLFQERARFGKGVVVLERAAGR